MYYQCFPLTGRQSQDVHTIKLINTSIPPISRKLETSSPSILLMAHSYLTAGQGSPDMSHPACMVLIFVWKSLQDESETIDFYTMIYFLYFAFTFIQFWECTYMSTSSPSVMSKTPIGDRGGLPWLRYDMYTPSEVETLLNPAPLIPFTETNNCKYIQNNLTTTTPF